MPIIKIVGIEDYFYPEKVGWKNGEPTAIEVTSLEHDYIIQTFEAFREIQEFLEKKYAEVQSLVYERLEERA